MKWTATRTTLAAKTTPGTEIETALGRTISLAEDVGTLAGTVVEEGHHGSTLVRVVEEALANRMRT